jgi:hypothetical protein
MIGSACFAVASLPGASKVSDRAVAITYFIGSIFFTAAAFEQLRTSRGDDKFDRWAAVIQFAGTILFNVSTFAAVDERLDPHAENLLVWTPDFVGSICFLVASGLASYAVWEQRADRRTRHIADYNLAGSVAFMASAIAAFTVPETSELVDASLATSGTLIGALCFFWAARLLLPGARVRADRH